MKNFSAIIIGAGGGGKVHRNFMHSVSEKYTVVGVRGACGNQEK